MVKRELYSDPTFHIVGLQNHFRRNKGGSLSLHVKMASKANKRLTKIKKETTLSRVRVCQQVREH